MKYFIGNTLRLEATFNDWDNQTLLTDPTLIKLVIYDIRFTKLAEYVLSEQNRLSLGKYYYFYTPSSVGTYYYEWYADIDGMPSLDRNQFIIVDK